MKFLVDGFSTDIAAGTYQVTINGITNPPYAGQPGTITINTWLNFTNTILN